MSTFKVISVDSISKKCSVCSATTNPSIFSTYEPKWKNKYVCTKCLLFHGVTQKEIDLILSNKGFKVTQNDVDRIKLVEWITAGTIQNGILEQLIELEKEDNEYFPLALHPVATNFKNSVVNAPRSINMDHFNEYVSFFDNDVELIKCLRNLAITNETENNFYKDMYIRSRNRTLSKKEVERLYASRDFKHFSDVAIKVWDLVDTDLSDLANCFIEDSEMSKIANIVEYARGRNTMTTKQFYYLSHRSVEYLNFLETGERPGSLSDELEAELESVELEQVEEEAVNQQVETNAV
jgi:hypothetical protein